MIPALFIVAAAGLCVPAQTPVELMVMTEVTAADAGPGDPVRLRGSLSVRLTRPVAGGREVALTSHVAAHAREGSDDALRVPIGPM